MAVYQDDNARHDRARVVNNFLQQSGVYRMEWPACSPDLNPIENLWDELDRKVRSNNPPPRDAQYLFQMLQAEWQVLPQRIFTNLVNSMVPEQPWWLHALLNFWEHPNTLFCDFNNFGKSNFDTYPLGSNVHTKQMLEIE